MKATSKPDCGTDRGAAFKKKSAMDSLSAIEKCFASLRDKSDSFISQNCHACS